ncbi:MAG: CHASE3 domain-containing protein [Verrucomicrobia bacterium]|nr:CHASE3 domain-containing protein [Verrucomicrobiota bacterium]
MTQITISPGRKIAIGFSLAILVLAGIGLVSYRSTVQFAESAENVARTLKTISVLRDTLADIVSAESEARGYVITGSERYLSLYRSTISLVEEDLKNLRALVRSPQGRKYLTDLERLARERLGRLKITVETRRLEGFEAALGVTGPGKEVMDELRQVAAKIENLQQQFLAEREHYANTLARRTGLAVILGGLFAVLLAATSTAFLYVDIAHRERLEKEVLDISEREQRRIGQDLHDGVCQQLTGISLFSRSLQHKLTGRLAEEEKEAAQITRLINDSIEQVRQVTRGLHPVIDEPAGLMMALRELADIVRKTGRLSCDFDCARPVPIANQVAATNLYRIAQEAVQNALRHSGAKAVKLALEPDDNSNNITLTVSDDGCGIPELRPRKGLGLEIMDYRARTIGGRIEVRRGDPCGTVVACVLPRSSLD